MVVYAIVILITNLWLGFNREDLWTQSVLFWSLYAVGDAVFETRKLVKDTSIDKMTKAVWESLKKLGWVSLLTVVCYGVEVFVYYLRDHLYWVS